MPMWAATRCWTKMPMNNAEPMRSISLSLAAAAKRPRRWLVAGMSRLAMVLVAAALLCATTGMTPALAQDKKPYDQQLFRLSEILGAIHYLRELCGGTDGQLWRKNMQELIDAEGSTALRRLALTRKFNFGYRSYSRTYNRCTPSAKTAISRFLDEGAQMSDRMVKNIP
jgi:uncharacterized protein (TIGR02301 family)